MGTTFRASAAVLVVLAFFSLVAVVVVEVEDMFTLACDAQERLWGNDALTMTLFICECSYPVLHELEVDTFAHERVTKWPIYFVPRRALNNIITIPYMDTIPSETNIAPLVPLFQDITSTN